MVTVPDGIQLLFVKADVVPQSLVLNMVELLKSYTVLEFLKSEIDIELLLKLAIVVPEFLISDTVPEMLMFKHWTKILNTWPITTTAFSAAKRCSR